MEDLPSSTSPDAAETTSATVNRQVTSRADVLRQASASLLRTNTTSPALYKRFSGINLFPELVRSGITVYYCSGWEQPYCHYKTSRDGAWTQPPGHDMFKVTDDLLDRAVKPFLPNQFVEKTDTVWAITFPGAEYLEFVPNNLGRDWDHPCGGGNYLIDYPGQYFLKNGSVHDIIPPPDRPALLEAKSVTPSSVCLVWNGPVAQQSDVVNYQIYRDDVLVAAVDRTVFEYEDTELIGLVEYRYTVRAVNRYEVVGNPSDPVKVTTGAPDKPSEVTNLHVSDHSDALVQLSWQKPLYHGGGHIEMYRIYRDGKPVAIKTFTSNSWETWTDSKVEPQGTYIYHVTACRQMPPRDETQFSVARQATLPLRFPSMAPTAPPATGDMKQITAYLATVIQHRDYEGLVSVGVQGQALPRLEMPRIEDGKTHIMMQGFNWHSCDNKSGHYNLLLSCVERMQKAALTMLWLPPPTASVSPQGYMPTRYHDLDSSYGTEKELRSLIETLRNHQIAPMLDFVANHRCGVKQDQRGDWTEFEDPDWGNWAIVSNNLQGYRGLGTTDTGASSQCAPDIDHTNETVRRDITEWVKWLFTDVGFASLRIDMAPGYAAKYQVEYVSSLGNPFTVGEYWSGDPNALQNYINAGRGVIAAYDFALYYILRRCVESGNFSELNDNGKVPGLIGRDSKRAVTFIDNHDTVHLDFVGRFADWNKDAVLRGYVYLLTHPGTPCLYWDHFHDFGDAFTDKLMALTQLRHEAKLTAECGVSIAASNHALYAAYISRHRCCHPDSADIAVKLGSADWYPQRGNNWNIKVFGNDFCVWSRN